MTSTGLFGEVSVDGCSAERPSWRCVHRMSSGDWRRQRRRLFGVPYTACDQPSTTCIAPQGRRTSGHLERNGPQGERQIVSQLAVECTRLPVVQLIPARRRGSLSPAAAALVALSCSSETLDASSRVTPLANTPRKLRRHFDIHALSPGSCRHCAALASVRANILSQSVGSGLNAWTAKCRLNSSECWLVE